MMIIKIAARNVFRNLRRSVMTALAICVGAASLIFFSQFINYVQKVIETDLVRRLGHVVIYRKGFFDFGSASPNSFSIHNYQSVVDLLLNDPNLKNHANVITPKIAFQALGGNFEKESSKFVIGDGFIPTDTNRMIQWDGYQLGSVLPPPEIGLSEAEPTKGFIGKGLAQLLGLCAELKVTNCLIRPDNVGDKPHDLNSSIQTRDFSGIPDLPAKNQGISNTKKFPRIELLSASADGRTNLIAFNVGSTTEMSNKNLNESYVGIPFNLAQELLYGQDKSQTMNIVLQLNDTKDMKFVQDRVQGIIDRNRLDLEVYNLYDIVPEFKVNMEFLTMMFSFTSLIMFLLSLFSTANTMGMSVLERTNEIGTLRSLGENKNRIRLQFLLEGALIGVIGSTAGVILGYLLGLVINHMHIMWLIPGTIVPRQLIAIQVGTEMTTFLTWLGLSLTATLASVIPANRAANLKIVEALGHV